MWYIVLVLRSLLVLGGSTLVEDGYRMNPNRGHSHFHDKLELMWTSSSLSKWKFSCSLKWRLPHMPKTGGFFKGKKVVSYRRGDKGCLETYLGHAHYVCKWAAIFCYFSDTKPRRWLLQKDQKIDSKHLVLNVVLCRLPKWHEVFSSPFLKGRQYGGEANPHSHVQV